MSHLRPHACLGRLVVLGPTLNNGCPFRWPNVDIQRWPNVSLLVGPSLGQHVGITLGKRVSV